MDVIGSIAVFVVSLYLLIKFSDIFILSAEKLGILWRIPKFIVGLTIISIGTSLPELATAIIAALKDNTQIIASNVFGSNISNILLVGGLSAIIIKQGITKREIKNNDLPFLFGSLLIVMFLSFDRVFNWVDGVIAILGYLFYIEYLYNNKRIIKDVEEEVGINTHKINVVKELIILIISMIVIYFSADYLVKGIELLSHSIHLGEDIISGILLALGTSLPELSVSIQASIKKKYDLVLGNILGSNIFNIFVVMGIPSFIHAIQITSYTLYILLPFAFSSTLLFYFITQNQEITKYEGYVMVLFYLVFIITTVYWISPSSSFFLRG